MVEPGLRSQSSAVLLPSGAPILPRAVRFTYIGTAPVAAERIVTGLTRGGRALSSRLAFLLLRGATQIRIGS